MLRFNYSLPAEAHLFTGLYVCFIFYKAYIYIYIYIIVLMYIYLKKI